MVIITISYRSKSPFLIDRCMSPIKIVIVDHFVLMTFSFFQNWCYLLFFALVNNIGRRILVFHRFQKWFFSPFCCPGNFHPVFNKKESFFSGSFIIACSNFSFVMWSSWSRIGWCLVSNIPMMVPVTILGILDSVLFQACHREEEGCLQLSSNDQRWLKTEGWRVASKQWTSADKCEEISTFATFLTSHTVCESKGMLRCHS